MLVLSRYQAIHRILDGQSRSSASVFWANVVQRDSNPGRELQQLAQRRQKNAAKEIPGGAHNRETAYLLTRQGS
jgi:hypothetical protein